MPCTALAAAMAASAAAFCLRFSVSYVCECGGQGGLYVQVPVNRPRENNAGLPCHIRNRFTAPLVYRVGLPSTTS